LGSAALFKDHGPPNFTTSRPRRSHHVHLPRAEDVARTPAIPAVVRHKPLEVFLAQIKAESTTMAEGN